MKESTKRLTRLALLTALGVMFLVLASVFPSGSLAMLAIASLGVCVARMQYGYGWGFGVFALTAGLGFLLYPNEVTIAYAGFFGYYPLVKSFFERGFGRAWEWTLKCVLCGVVVALYYTLAQGFIAVDTEWPWYWLCIFCAAAFFVYDYCLTLLVRIYLVKIARYLK